MAILLMAAGVGMALPDPAASRPPVVAAAPVDLTATAQIARMMHQPRTVNLLVSNHGPEPVEVQQVELVTESFVPTGPVPKDTTIPAGGARALSVVYGEARCDGAAAPPLAPSTVVLALASPSGPVTVEVPLPDQDDELLLLLARDCAMQRVTGTVEIGFETWSEAVDGTLQGELVLRRRDLAGPEPVRLDNVAGNVLFRVTSTAAGPPLGELALEQDRLAVPVSADANRCDGHAVGEAKQRFLLRVWVSVGDDAELPVQVELDPADHSRFEQLLHDRCGL